MGVALNAHGTTGFAVDVSGVGFFQPSVFFLIGHGSLNEFMYKRSLSELCMRL